MATPISITATSSNNKTWTATYALPAGGTSFARLFAITPNPSPYPAASPASYPATTTDSNKVSYPTTPTLSTNPPSTTTIVNINVSVGLPGGSAGFGPSTTITIILNY